MYIVYKRDKGAIVSNIDPVNELERRDLIKKELQNNIFVHVIEEKHLQFFQMRQFSECCRKCSTQLIISKISNKISK